jgi:hypothetical protein
MLGQIPALEDPGGCAQVHIAFLLVADALSYLLVAVATVGIAIFSHF